VKTLKNQKNANDRSIDRHYLFSFQEAISWISLFLTEHYDINMVEADLNLLELALRLRWSSAAARAAKYPDEIAEQDQDGLTILHWACCNPPPFSLFRALMAHEGPIRRAACVKDMNGMTPLMCACACRAPLRIILLLIESCPKCVLLSDSDGWTALHFLTCTARNEPGRLRYILSLAQKILVVHPMLAASTDSSGRTPIMTLYEMYEVELLCFNHHGGVDEEFEVFWDLIRLFLDSLMPPKHAGSPMLHRLVQVPNCPTELVMAVSSMCPESLLLQDSSGNTPLHLAVVQKSPSLEDFLVHREPGAATLRNTDGETPFTLATKVYGDWRTIHSKLLEADPSSLETMALDDSLYADILGQIAGCANTLFHILRGKPSLVKFRNLSSGSSSMMQSIVLE
jgi:hypothetical protein